MSQLGTVRRLLEEAGEKGVEVHDLVYEHGITDAAAVVFKLRHTYGLDIIRRDNGETEDGRQRLCTYILRAKKPTPIVPAEGLFSVPDPAPELPLPCGCVRASDGRFWVSRCEYHQPREAAGGLL